MINTLNFLPRISLLWNELPAAVFPKSLVLTGVYGRQQSLNQVISVVVCHRHIQKNIVLKATPTQVFWEHGSVSAKNKSPLQNFYLFNKFNCTR